MNIDFRNDWKDFVEKFLSIHEDDIDKLTNYFFYNFRKKIITKKRKVYKSKEFICPHSQYNNLQKFIFDIENGVDINSYLSENVKYPKQTDGLLNSWNIYHFHFDTTIGKKRSNDLIFSLVKDDTIFFIQVYNHNSWYEREILNIINNNWSHLTPSLKGIKGSALTDEQIKNLRQKNVMCLIDLGDGKNYISQGNDIPVEDIIKTNVLMEDLKRLENIVTYNKNNIADAFGYSKYDNFSLKLNIEFSGDKIEYLIYDPFKKTGLNLQGFQLNILHSKI